MVSLRLVARLVLGASFLTACPGRSPGYDAAADARGDGSADANADGGIPVAPAREPEPLPITEWRYGYTRAGNSDQVTQALDNGTFTYPAVGASLGTTWDSYEPTEMGEIPRPTSGYVYAATQIDVPAAESIRKRCTHRCIHELRVVRSRLVRDWPAQVHLIASAR